MHEVEESPVAPAVRILLFVAAALVFLAGVQLFVFPLRTDEYFAWTIASPMTAVFLGAAYWSAVGLEVAAARAEGWAGARIALPTVFVFTALTLVVTLIHLDLFHLGSDFALNTRLVTWFWLAIYGGVPVLMVVAYARQRRVGLATPPPSGLPVVVRVVLVVLAVVLLGFGFSLLVAPSWADGGWPWALDAAHRAGDRGLADRAGSGGGGCSGPRRRPVAAAPRRHRGALRRAPGRRPPPLRRRTGLG